MIFHFLFILVKIINVWCHKIMKTTRICDKVFKNGPSKICGRQPLKTLKWYSLLKSNFTWSILEYLQPYLSPELLENQFSNHEETNLLANKLIGFFNNGSKDKLWKDYILIHFKLPVTLLGDRGIGYFPCIMSWIHVTKR